MLGLNIPYVILSEYNQMTNMIGKLFPTKYEIYIYIYIYICIIIIIKYGIFKSARPAQWNMLGDILIGQRFGDVSLIIFRSR